MKRSTLLSMVGGLAGLAGVLGSGSPALAQAQTPFLGQLMLVGFSFCPVNWTDANGQLLSIAQNTALFSLYGTTYGGNGIQTFGLPDLRGRIPAHVGQGPGLSPVVQGEIMGTDTTILTVNQLPRHNHPLMTTTSGPDNVSPNNALLPTFPAAQHVYSSTGAAGVLMKPTAIGIAGNNQPFDQHQPTLVLRWCVALSGVFPSRN